MANNHDLEPLLTAHQDQLNLVMDEGASIDNKALALLAIVVAILIFMAQADLHLTQWWHAIVVIGPHALALACIACAVWPRDYKGASPNLDKYPESLTMGHDDLVLQLLVNTFSAVQYNDILNTIRWRWCAGAIVFLLVGTAILAAIL